MTRPRTAHATSYRDGAHHWEDYAACKGIETDLFYPLSTGVDGRAQAEVAKAYCRDCPVREVCATVALERQERFGIWGGLTEDERDEILRGPRRRRGRPRKAAVT